MEKTNKIQNGRGYPEVTKSDTYYWVKHGLSKTQWDICIWDGYCFKTYGLQGFDLVIALPREWVVIKKPN